MGCFDDDSIMVGRFWLGTVVVGCVGGVGKGMQMPWGSGISLEEFEGKKGVKGMIKNEVKQQRRESTLLILFPFPEYPVPNAPLL